MAVIAILSYKKNYFDWHIANSAGYLKWNSMMWVNATFNGSESDGILLTHHCPLSYCKSGYKIVNLNAFDNKAQCANNHAGILCGGCENNYSPAIGSSPCIRCSNNYHLLIIAFFFIISIVLVSLSVISLHFGKRGFNFFSHSTSGSLLELSSLCVAIPLV